MPYRTLWAPCEVSVDPFGPVWTNYRPQMALFGQYGHLWPLYGSLSTFYSPLWTITGPFRSLMYFFLTLHWPLILTKWIPMATCAIYFLMANFGTIGWSIFASISGHIMTNYGIIGP